jgi:hypothetical protein
MRHENDDKQASKFQRFEKASGRERNLLKKKQTLNQINMQKPIDTLLIYIE